MLHSCAGGRRLSGLMRLRWIVWSSWWADSASLSCWAGSSGDCRRIWPELGIWGGKDTAQRSAADVCLTAPAQRSSSHRVQFLASGLLPARLPGTKDDALFYSHAEQISTLDVAFSVLHRNAPQDELDCRIINGNCLNSRVLLN